MSIELNCVHSCLEGDGVLFRGWLVTQKLTDCKSFSYGKLFMQTIPYMKSSLYSRFLTVEVPYTEGSLDGKFLIRTVLIQKVPHTKRFLIRKFPYTKISLYEKFLIRCVPYTQDFKVVQETEQHLLLLQSGNNIGITHRIGLTSGKGIRTMELLSIPMSTGQLVQKPKKLHSRVVSVSSGV